MAKFANIKRQKKPGTRSLKDLELVLVPALLPTTQDLGQAISLFEMLISLFLTRDGLKWIRVFTVSGDLGSG